MLWAQAAGPPCSVLVLYRTICQLTAGFSDHLLLLLMWTGGVQAAVPAGQSMLLFGFAGAIMDYGLRRGLLQPFGQMEESSRE